MEHLFDLDIILKLLLATLCGAIIGLERYIHGRSAGLRTYLLVCVAFASIAVLSEKLSLASGPLLLGNLRLDPGRLMAGGLTGIGFLGAGIIIRGGLTVHGLTTAAGIWAISVAGLALGSGCYDLGATLCLITLLSLTGLRYVELRLNKDIYKSIALTIQKPGISRQAMENSFKDKGLRVIAVDVSDDRSNHVLTYKFILNGRTEKSFHEAYQEVASLEDIRSIQLTGQYPG